MQYTELRRTGKFLLFSCSAGLIELGSFALFNEVFHWPYWGAYLTALVLLSTLLEHRLADVQGWNGYLVTFLNMVLNFVTEFLYQRFVVYRNSLDTNKLAHTHS